MSKKKRKKKKHRKHTPITSEAQQGAMGAAYAAKKGEMPMSKLKGPAKEMAKSMPKAELKRHLKESKGKKLPQKVSDKKQYDNYISGRRRAQNRRR